MKNIVLSHDDYQLTPVDFLNIICKKFNLKLPQYNSTEHELPNNRFAYVCECIVHIKSLFDDRIMLSELVITNSEYNAKNNAAFRILYKLTKNLGALNDTDSDESADVDLKNKYEAVEFKELYKKTNFLDFINKFISTKKQRRKNLLLEQRQEKPSLVEFFFDKNQFF